MNNISFDNPWLLFIALPLAAAVLIPFFITVKLVISAEAYYAHLRVFGKLARHPFHAFLHVVQIVLR